MPVILDVFPFETDQDVHNDKLESVSEAEYEHDVAESENFVAGSEDTHKKIYYRCDKCSYQTEIKSLLDRHIAKHELDRPFLCSVCNFSDYDHSTFVDHLVGHQLTKIIRCTFCSFKCHSPIGLKNHILRHRPVEMLDCSMCEFSSNYVRSMKNHIEAKHTKIHSCNHCKQSMTKHELIEHCETVHGALPSPNVTESLAELAEEINEAEPSEGSQNSDDPPEIKPIVAEKKSKSGCGTSGHHYCNCSPEEPDELLESPLSPKPELDLTLKCETDELKCCLCGFIGSNFFSLKYHNVVFHKKVVSCDYCPLVMTKHDVIQHVAKEHKMEICAQPVDKNDAALEDWEESAYSDVEDPMVSSTMEADHLDTYNKIKCPHCGYLVKRANMDIHVLRLHTDKHSCEHCSIVMTKYELIEHNKNIHGLKLSLNELHKSFHKEPQLNAKDHAAENPDEQKRCSSAEEKSVCTGNTNAIKCSLCEYSTNLKSSLELHVFRVHTLKYSCNYCLTVKSKHEIIEHCQNTHGIKISRNATNKDNIHFKKAKLSTNEHQIVRNLGEPKASSTQNGKLSAHKTSTRKLICSVCQFSSTTKWNMKQHRERFHKKKFACKRCKAVMTKYCLMRHKKSHCVIAGGRMSPRESRMLQVWRGKKSVELRKTASPLITGTKRKQNIANRGFSKGVHSKTHKCSICSYSSSSSNNLQRHIQSLHRNKYSCKQCTAVMTKHELTKHWKKAHKDLFQTRRIGRLGEKVDNLERSKELNSSISGSEITNPADEINEAFSMHHSVVPSKLIANPKFRKSQNAHCTSASLSLPTSNAEFQSELFQCHHCSYKTKIKSLLRNHVSLHLPEGQFSCPECDFKENRTAVFAEHVKSHNKSKNSLACCFCSFISASLSAFKDHINTHRAVGTYYCSECHYSCSQSSALARHTKIPHENHICPECHTTGSKIWLSIHMKKCHPPSNLRPLRIKSKSTREQDKLGSSGGRSNIKSRIPAQQSLSCQIRDNNVEAAKVMHLKCNTCEYQTAREDLLARHVAKHDPLECPICGLKFNTGNAFTVHLSSHNSPNSTYKCFYCEHVAKNIKNLRMHLSRHVEALKKRDCPLCEFSCTQRNRLKEHLTTHDKVDGTKKSGGVSDAPDKSIEIPAEVCVERSLASSCSSETNLTAEPRMSLASTACDLQAVSDLMKFKRAKWLHDVESTTVGLEKAANENRKYLEKRCLQQVKPQVDIIFNVKKNLNKRSSDVVASNLENNSSTKMTLPIQIALLQCKTCDYRTAREDLMIRHEAKHSSIVCPICSIEINEGYAFAVHLNKHNNSESRYKCYYCSHVCESVPNLYVHLASHVDALNQRDCSECEFSCLLLSGLERHQASHSKKKIAKSGKLTESCSGTHPKHCTLPTKVHPEVNLEFSARWSCEPGRESNASSSKSFDASDIQSSSGPDVILKKRAKKSTLSDKLTVSKLDERRSNDADLSERSSALQNFFHTLKPTLRCHDCSYQTKIKSLMRRHVKLHLPEGQFVCPKCDFRARKSRTFAKHVASHVQSGPPYKCCFCSFSAPVLQYLGHHVKMHRPVKELLCSKCEYSSNISRNMDNHYNNYHIKKYSCPECPKVASRRALLLHVKRYHPSVCFKLLKKTWSSQSELNQKSYEGSVSPSSKKRIAPKKSFHSRVKRRDGLKGKLLHCRSCKFQTPKKKWLLLHEANHFPLKSHETPPTKSADVNPKIKKRCSAYSMLDFNRFWDQADSATCSKSISSLNLHHCVDCDFITMREDLFGRHTAKHEPWICPTCSFLVPEHSKIVAHLAKHHNNPFKCCHCSYMTKNRHHLLYHLSVHDNSLKIYDCPFCEFCSNRSDILANHLNVHTMPVSQTRKKSSNASPDIPRMMEVGTSKADSDPNDSMQTDGEASSVLKHLQVNLVGLSQVEDSTKTNNGSGHGSNRAEVTLSIDDTVSPVDPELLAICPSLTSQSGDPEVLAERSRMAPTFSADSIPGNVDASSESLNITPAVGVDPTSADLTSEVVQHQFAQSTSACHSTPNPNPPEAQASDDVPLTWKDFIKVFKSSGSFKDPSNTTIQEPPRNS